MIGLLCPYRPAVYSPSRSTYSWPSTSVNRQPAPLRIVSGNGGWNRVVRVLPPGITRTAASYAAALPGLSAMKALRAAASAAWTQDSLESPDSGPRAIGCINGEATRDGRRRRTGRISRPHPQAAASVGGVRNGCTVLRLGSGDGVYVGPELSEGNVSVVGNG